MLLTLYLPVNFKYYNWPQPEHSLLIVFFQQFYHKNFVLHWFDIFHKETTLPCYLKFFCTLTLSSSIVANIRIEKNSKGPFINENKNLNAFNRKKKMLDLEL